MPKRDEIFNAALHLFARRGFRSTSMSEVTSLAGVAEGTVFYHFGSKNQLFIAILDDTRRLLADELTQAVGQHECATGMETLEATVVAFFATAEQHEERFLLLHHLYAHELAEVDLTCRQHLTAIYEHLIGTFEKAIHEGIADGSVRALSEHKSALVVFALLDGLVRLKSNKLYDPESLYGEGMEMCRRMFATEDGI